MKKGCIIFDMDGLLIDSEPLWEEAGKLVLERYGVHLSEDDYASSVGLRTQEWIELWFETFKIDAPVEEGIQYVIEIATQLILEKGELMPGVERVLKMLKEAGYTLGLASSSPMSLIEAATKRFNIDQYFEQKSSAEFLSFGKPHPQVYIECAQALGYLPYHCIAFEDSFNGMIAAKAARMKCIVIPAAILQEETRWQAADARLKSLEEFELELLDRI